MAGSINKVTLLGHLGGDPQVRSFQNGGKIVSFSLATSEGWKDKQTGDRKERTEWHKVVINNEGLAKVAEQYLRKGSKVYVEGKLETRKWQDQSGRDCWSTEVVLRPYAGELVLLSDGGKGGRDSGGRDDAQGRDRDDDGGRGYGGGGRPGSASGARTSIDDEIPFSPEGR